MTDDKSQTDGYYGDEDIEADEIDLSFLDEKDDNKKDKQ